VLAVALLGCPSARSNDTDAGGTRPGVDASAPDATASDAALLDASTTDAAPIDAGPAVSSVRQGSFGPSLGIARSSAHALVGRIPASGVASTATGATHRLEAWSGPIR
jgi:hypothetical protein